MSLRSFSPDPVIEEYKKHVDESLLRENLRRTPEQRILAMISMSELVESMRLAMKRRLHAHRRRWRARPPR
jgi:hypothetical protein